MLDGSINYYREANELNYHGKKLLFLGLAHRFTFYSLFIILLALIFARYALSIRIPVPVFLVVVSVTALISDFNELLSLIASMIPLSAALQYKYCLLIIMAIYILKNWKNGSVSRKFAIFLFLCVWEFAHIVYGSFSISDYFRSLVEFLLISLVFFDDYFIYKLSVDYRKITRVLAISTTLLCVVILSINLNKNGALVIQYSSGITRFGYVDATFNDFNISVNPNILGGLCIFSMSLLFQAIASKSKSLIDILLLIPLFVFALLTQSRMAVISGMIMFILFLFVNFSISNFIQRILISSLILAIVFILLNKFFPDLFEKIILRFSYDDLSNGRNELIISYNNLFFSNFSVLFFGVGLQNHYFKLVNGLGMENVPHNAFQEVIAVWGIVGLILILLFIILVIKKINKSNIKRRFINYLPLIQFVFIIFNDQFITNGQILLMLFISLLSLSVPFSKVLNKRSE